MAQAIRVAILGAGWPGAKHAEGYRAAGGFQIVAVADLIPSRRQALMQQFGIGREVADASEILKDPAIDAVSVCLPNHLHAPIALAALKAGKHVVCEMPPCLNASEAKKISAAASKSGKTVLLAAQRRFGAAEQAARQAIEKGYVGKAYHVRASWMRTRGVPSGTGWFTDPARSGGGVVMDLGASMLDLAWSLLGQPQLSSIYGITGDQLTEVKPERTGQVEETAFVFARFEGGKSLELSATWAINQPPRQQGTLCRVHGDGGAIDLYTSQGPLLYRNFGTREEAKESALKQPTITLHHAMMRHFKDVIRNGKPALPGPNECVSLMQIIDAIYKSAKSRKSVQGKG